MAVRIAEDYYYWCCDWCDTENLVPFDRLHTGAYCGACHRPMDTPHDVVGDRRISAGLC